MTEFSPFSCPIFLGPPRSEWAAASKASAAYGREPNGVRVEPGKLKTGSWTQELVPSSAQENEWQKRGA